MISKLFKLQPRSRKTKIICTIGPSSGTKEKLSKMIDSGMDVVRFNLSHGSYDEYRKWAITLRELAREKNRPVALLCDLPGAKIRLGELYDGAKTVVLNQGETIYFTSGKPKSKNELSFADGDYLNHVKIGDKILLNDGKIELVARTKEDERLASEVTVAGEIAPFQGINLPDTKFDLPALSSKDLGALRFALEIGADAVGLSFVLSAENVKAARAEITRKVNHGTQDAPLPYLVAKIERGEAVEGINKIIAVSDAIMIARGDLGLELPETEVPIIQKKIIQLCLEAGKPVITATQMLDSMQKNPRPTRAEVSDVANAVFDGTDALMLSGETSTGDYPLESLEEMAKIAIEAEASQFERNDLEIKEGISSQVKITDAVGGSACEMAAKIGADAIVCATGSGYTARMIAKFRPKMPIIALTPHENTFRQLNFIWGVEPYILPGIHTTDELLTQAVTLLKEHQLVKSGNKIVITAGHPVGEVGQTNLIKAEKIV